MIFNSKCSQSVQKVFRVRYCYHFGVATWLREHMLPEGLTPEAASTDAFPANLTFSGSSGGALVAAVLGCGLEPRKIFDMVLETLF